MKNIWLLVIFMLILNFTFGQNDIVLQGKIIDRSSNNPISFATIFYKYGGTIADEFGLFKIAKLRATDTLKISCIGYRNKYIPVLDLMASHVNTISMDRHIYNLAEVKVKAKKKRIGSIQIIRNALNRIEHNYPTNPTLYNGYYREYLMQNGQYFNLLESIIDLEDQGFGTADNFNARILYKKQNQNFEIKEDALIPYDNTLLKTVPDAKMPITCNELLLLRLHDPIRRSNHFALSYIDTLQNNFIRNHHFKRPEIVYFDNKALYLIRFKNANLINNKEPKASTKGEIYIDPENWGIHKIIYMAYLKDGKMKNKLYELNLSYQQLDNKYYLNYISFNNFFQLADTEKDFKISYVEVYKMLGTDYIICACLTMNKKVDIHKSKPLDRNKYSITYDNHKIKIDSVIIREEKIFLYSESLSKIRFFKNDKLAITAKNIYDINGSKIDEKHFESFYQYREFFVRNSLQEYEALNMTEFYDPTLPMLKNPVYIKQYQDTTWINTPLIKQEETNKK